MNSTNKENFDKVFEDVSGIYEFGRYCRKNDFNEDHQKYIVVKGLFPDWPDIELAPVVDMKFKSRSYSLIKRMKPDHQEFYAQVVEWIHRNDPEGEEQEEVAIITNLTDLEHLQSAINNPGTKSSDRINSIKLKRDIIQEEQGAAGTPAWQKYWQDVMIPNLSQAIAEDLTFDRVGT